VDAIDWSAAQRIGELIAGSPPYGGVRAETVEPLAYDFARRVSDYSGLALPAALPPLEAVDRAGWIAANLQSMRPVLGGLTERVGGGSGLLSIGPLRSAMGFLLGAQVGALTGVLSQRVLCSMPRLPRDCCCSRRTWRRPLATWGSIATSWCCG
jgi:hypothetical protein